ncbi:unnamed protein product [Pedinophyceae sp. YPF-701]|nr:unnamed protein product [Pedinophyceae sp. YPF-701]
MAFTSTHTASAPVAAQARPAARPRASAQQVLRAPLLVRGPAPAPARHSVLARSGPADEIDPTTGEIIPGSGLAREPVASTTIKVGKYKWAVRRSSPDEGAKKQKEAVLLLHGIGSSSYSYREVAPLLAKEGFETLAVDWIGHGGSDKPSPDEFDYTQESYVRALDAFIEEAGLGQPLVLVVNGFVLGNYALDWAQRNQDKFDKLIMLNTPLSPRKSKLPPTLAAYKSPIPFLRPAAGSPFPGDLWNADGLAYVMERKVADAYLAPYEGDAGAAASEAVRATMEAHDFKTCLQDLDYAYESFKKDSLLLFGGKDRNVNLTEAVDWLDSKRTNMQLMTLEERLGHMPQEDYAEPVAEAMAKWIRGEKFQLSLGKKASKRPEGVGAEK